MTTLLFKAVVKVNGVIYGTSTHPQRYEEAKEALHAIKENLSYGLIERGCRINRTCSFGGMHNFGKAQYTRISDEHRKQFPNAFYLMIQRVQTSPKRETTYSYELDCCDEQGNIVLL